MKLNSFKKHEGKPMIYSLASAEEFLMGINSSFTFQLDGDRFVRIRGTYAEHTGLDNKTKFEVWSYVLTEYTLSIVGGWCGVEWVDYTTDHAKTIIWLLYKYRKYINRRFR